MENPTIKTSGWFETLPDDHIKIGVSRGSPRGMAAGYKLYKTLAPGSWFNSVDETTYKQRYFAEILEPLNPETVVAEIIKKADGKIPCLVCFEGSNDAQWCHRGFVSAWLNETLSLKVPEFGLDQNLYGWQHPKLPKKYQRQTIDRTSEAEGLIDQKFERDGEIFKVVSISDDGGSVIIEDDTRSRFVISTDLAKSYILGQIGAAKGVAPS